MRVRLVWMELAAIGLGLVLIQLGALFVELQTAFVSDWFITLVPLVWLNVSILVVYALFRQLYLGDEGPGTARPTVWDRLRPDWDSLKHTTGVRRLRIVWLVGGLAYLLAYMLLQGILVLDVTGSIAVGAVYLPSPIGYGPGVALSPAPYVGLLLRPYTLAAGVALSIYSGLVLALFFRVLSLSRRHLVGFSGPLAGLTVLCPACVATPATGLFLAYLAPAVTVVGLGTLPLFSATLAGSTALLFVSLFLLLWTVAWLSRLLRVTPKESAAGGPEVVVGSKDYRSGQGDDENRLD